MLSARCVKVPIRCNYTDFCDRINAIELVQESILPALQYDYTDGKDCLGYVIYPEKTLVNASFLTGTSYVNTAE